MTKEQRLKLDKLRQEYKQAKDADLIARKIEAEIKAGSTKTLKELLWTVPTNILAEYAKD